MNFSALSMSMPQALLTAKQLVRIMKICAFVLLVCLQHVTATGFGQVTLNEKNSTLERVIQRIEMQTNYVFIYDENKLNIKTIDVTVSNVTLEKALEACFKDLPVNYSIVGKNIILQPASRKIITVEVPSTPVIQVAGIITDSLGVPLNRATVFFVKRKKQSPQLEAVVTPSSSPALSPSNVAVAATYDVTYVTSSDGRFFMDAEEGDILGVSYVGFRTYQFNVRKNMPFQNIVMYIAPQELGVVMVQTGYQTLSKERATGSFSKPDMKVFANRAGSMDVVARLDGQIPGLTVGQEQNFNATTRVSTRKALIRGTSSIQLATQPLFVVNGVIVTDFSAVNIDDIADITVLKDAAAAAIWGSQAANGVIVVVTKSGIKNQKIKVTYSGFVNFQGKPNFAYQRNLSSSQYIQAAKEIFDPTAYPYSQLYTSFVAPHDQILYDQFAGVISEARANQMLDSLAAIDNRDQIKDLWFRNARTTNHTVTASGGSRAYSFFASLGFTDTRTNALAETNRNYRINLDQNFTPNDRVSISLSTQLANNVSSAKEPISIGSDFLPYQLFKDNNGNNTNLAYIYGQSPEARANYQSLSKINLANYSPFDELNSGHTNTNGLSINVVANASVKLFKGISFLGTYGYLTSPSTTTGYDDYSQYSWRKNLINFTVAPTVNSIPVYFLPTMGGTYRENNTNQRNWTVRNQLVYNYSGRNGNDLISLQGGQEASARKTSGTTTTILGYDENLLTSPIIDYIALSEGVFGTVGGAGFYYIQPYQVEQYESRFNSYFGLASYTLNKKYSIDASWRVDHSNLFGSDVSAQNKPVYSFGAKWNITGEQFMKDVSWVNQLALRATYGITGNSPYATSATTLDVLYAEQYTSYPKIAGPAYGLQSAANNKLTWETTHTTNLGLDFAILKNRLSGSIEYYHKNTTSLLGNVPLDIFTGQGSATANIGNLTNDGVNIGINSINVQSNNFTWSTSFVLGYNKNKLVSYSKEESYMNSASYRLFANYIVGYSLSPIFAYKYAGLDAAGDPQIELADGKITKSSSEATAKDLKYMGSIVPKFNGGLTNNFRYKQFDLFVNTVYSFGAVMRKDVNQFYTDRLTGSPQSFSGNVHSDFANRWKKPGDEKFTDIPSYTSSSFYNYVMRNTGYYTNADINVVSASYVKLREIGLAYNLDNKVNRWLGIQGATLRMQVNNILLWKANNAGLDPEFQNYSYGDRGMSIGQHTVSIGANINF